MARILWAPRDILVGRVFRLPVEAKGEVTLEAGPFEVVQRSEPREGVIRYFLRAPMTGQAVRIKVRDAAGETTADVRVSTLNELRQVRKVGPNDMPRRWPLGGEFRRSKTHQTLTDQYSPAPLSAEAQQRAAWVMSLSDAEAWAQLPPNELPRNSTVNETDGCPKHGKELFKFGGFYPWRTTHTPPDYRMQCPVGGEKYPTNNVVDGDFLSGAFADDGYGYFDAAGKRYLFAAGYNWFQCQSFTGHISTMQQKFLEPGLAEEERKRVATRLGLLIVRQAVEEVYLSAAPQFRFGTLFHTLTNGLWGPPDVAAVDGFPAFGKGGTVQYCVSMPYVTRLLAFAYDAVFPYLQKDEALVAALRQLGVEVVSPGDVQELIEEMFATFIQDHRDGVSGSNHPGTSLGTLAALRVLDPPDVTSTMDYLYDECDDQLRTFVTNGFYPDGVCYEASGGYCAMHVLGAYELWKDIEALRKMRPEAVTTERYPSLAEDAKFPLITYPYVTTVMCGKTYALYGDDRAPGCMAEGCDRTKTKLEGEIACGLGWVSPWNVYLPAFRMNPTLFLARVLNATGLADQEPRAKAMVAKEGATIPRPSLQYDSGGIGILRLRRRDGTDRAAAFVHYLCQPFHRHDDFLHTEFVAFDRPWSFDFGYPATHTTCWYWEGNWATHNRGRILGGDDEDVISTGQCNLFLDGEAGAAIDVEGVEGQFHDWRLWTPQDKRHRRLLVLVPTVGEGMALIDLYRLRGGKEHWRTYMGIQGTLEWQGKPLAACSGTAAGPEIGRNEIDKAPLSRQALAMMDEVREGSGAGSWKAVARCKDDATWCMDVHGLEMAANTRATVCRATHPLTEPKDSPYSFEPLLLARTAEAGEVSSFDMVFEPHHQTPTIRKIVRLTSRENPDAAAVRLELVDGSAVTVLWNPWSEKGCRFEGGWELEGMFGLWREDASGKRSAAAVAVGGGIKKGAGGQGSGVGVKKDEVRATRKVARASVVEADRVKKTITVQLKGEEGFEAGRKVRVMPRGHWYRVERVEKIAPNRERLTLDLTSVLSSVRVHAVEKGEVAVSTMLPLAWAGYFRKCTLETREGQMRIPVLDVRMREDKEIAYLIVDVGADPKTAQRLKKGQWADIVDYQPGDELAGEGAEWV